MRELVAGIRTGSLQSLLRDVCGKGDWGLDAAVSDAFLNGSFGNFKIHDFLVFQKRRFVERIETAAVQVNLSELVQHVYE